MKKSEIKLTGLQIKSIKKLEKFSALLDEMEKEFGIREVMFIMDDCFICPDINLSDLKDTPMNKLIIKLINTP